MKSLDIAREGRIRHIDDIIPLVGQLSLREESQEMVISAMSVHEHDPGQAIAGDLPAGIIEQAQAEFCFQCDRAGKGALPGSG